MTHLEPESKNWSIVAADNFVRATRDSGYSSTASAISELVDNSIQAEATRIKVNIKRTQINEIEISVVDNGCGMDLFTLRQALRFGGSSRFNNRSGLGRFGMGLPNSSLSQARRVIVTSWSNMNHPNQRKKNILGSGPPLQTYLDIDEIASGKLTEVPKPKKLAQSPVKRPGRSGTLVEWKSCDRLDYKRVSTIERHVKRELSQRFRHFLNKGIKVYVNNDALSPIDPLFFIARQPKNRSKLYGQEILYTISADPSNPKSETGVVRVRFTELPVSRWAPLSNGEKRKMGIINQAGVSIIRAGREVDYGWYFFGAKRKENYDDWWRCEVCFDPILDEVFGLTHTKQQTKPQQYLLDILTPDMEEIARTLNRRAREAHNLIKLSEKRKRSEMIAGEKTKYLSPISTNNQNTKDCDVMSYQIEAAPLTNGCFYSYKFLHSTLILTLDPDHAFYREVYLPLQESHSASANHLRTLIELLVLAAARSELGVSPEHSHVLAHFREVWGEVAETFMGG